MYTTPLSTLISSVSLNHHLYADDTQLFLSFHPSEFHSNVTHLQNALQQISFWMTANLLTLSILLKLSFFLLDLNNNFLKYTTLLSLQPTLLATLTLFLMNTLPSPTKSLHFLRPATRELRCIRPYLDFKTASTIATSIVHSKLDYCNSLYHNLPNYQFNRLQQTQKSLARAVVKAPKSSHITPILIFLHWFKVNERIEYKLFSYLQSSYNQSTQLS